MELDRALLDQADLLLSTDPRRPKQVNLRRAVSAAYYSVFHLLVRKATDRVVGNGQGDVSDDLRAQVSRWYGHDQMKKVCGWFGPIGGPPKEVSDLLGYPKPGVVPPRLVRLAGTFVDLQEERHKADYDIAYVATRQDATTALDKARLAFEDVDALTGDPVFNLFLTVLLTGDKVVRSR